MTKIIVNNHFYLKKNSEKILFYEILWTDVNSKLKTAFLWGFIGELRFGEKKIYLGHNQKYNLEILL